MTETNGRVTLTVTKLAYRGYYSVRLEENVHPVSMMHNGGVYMGLHSDS